MYYPIILPFYLLVSTYKNKKNNLQLPTKSEIYNVLRNLIFSDMLYISYRQMRPDIDTINILQFFGFYIMQDLYFYTIHKYLFHKLAYSLHKKHHSVYSPFHAWYCSLAEQFILNAGSIAFADYIFPFPNWLFTLLILQQTYTSVNGHAPSSPHSEHHSNPSKHFGNIYIFDWLFGSY